jgi:hypothetical protein
MANVYKNKNKELIYYPTKIFLVGYSFLKVEQKVSPIFITGGFRQGVVMKNLMVAVVLVMAMAASAVGCERQGVVGAENISCEIVDKAIIELMTDVSPYGPIDSIKNILGTLEVVGDDFTFTQGGYEEARGLMEFLLESKQIVIEAVSDKEMQRSLWIREQYSDTDVLFYITSKFLDYYIIVVDKNGVNKTYIEDID